MPLLALEIRVLVLVDSKISWYNVNYWIIYWIAYLE